MTERFYSPVIKYTTNTLKTLPGALLYFYETGTSTPKTTWSDPERQTESAHPVPALADGTFPPIFINGVYRVELKSAAGVTQPGWPVDDVGSPAAGFPFQSWSSTYSYSEDDLVTYGGEFYQSLADANVGNTPSTSPAFWQKKLFLDAPTAESYLNGNADGTYTWLTIAQTKSDLSLPTDTVADLALKAPLESPEFTGDPTAPTPAAGDNSESLATTEFVRRDAITTVETIAALQALGEATDGQTITVLSGSNTGDFIYNSVGSGSAAFNNIVPDTLPGRFEKIDSSSAQVVIDATPQRLDDVISGINIDVGNRALTTLTNATEEAEANLFDLSEIVLSAPSGFPWTPSFGIYRNRGGVFCVDLDPKSLQPKRPTTKLWVDVVIGDDANSGISPSLPFKTLLAALNSATYTGTSGPCVIYINDGFYAYDQSMAAGLIIRPTSLIGIGGKPRLTGALSGASPTWTQQIAPNTNVYSANISAASMIWDSSVTSDNGYFYRYTSVASVAACQALAGSFYFTGSVLYVHALSGISPGAEIYINRNGNGHVSHTTTSALYCENISFELAGTFNFNVTGGAAAAPAVFNRCDFLYMMVNGFYTNRNGNIYLFDCHAGNNGRDGFNYELNDVARTQNVLEVNCRGIKNGWDTTGTNNGSTAHYYTNIISVNCYMDRNADRQIHDVDAACRWIVGSYAGRATNGSVVPYESFNYGSGRETGDTTQMWIDSISSQGSAVDLFVGDGCTIYTRRISPKTNSGDGTITSF